MTPLVEPGDSGTTAGADAAVVGGGIVGLATAYALTERGATVHLFERGMPGNGQSGGESRLFRHSHDDPRMVAVTRESRAVWREWQERLGVELVSGDGVIALGPTATRRLEVIRSVGDIDARRVDAGELARRLPLLAPFEGEAVFDADGGSIRTTAAVGALAAALGDAVIADEVLSVRETGGVAEVTAGGRRGRYGMAVICAGRGTAALAKGVGIEVPVALGVHARVSFAVRGEAPERLACIQDGSGAWGETGVYGAPLPGNRVYALGLSQSVPVGPEGSPDAGALARLGTRAAAWAGAAMPGLDPEPVGLRTCWVTRLPWGDDGMAVWRAGPVLVAAGHNLFKQAPGLGRALAAVADGEPLPDDLEPEARLGRSA
jgi:sarcosine oxidase